MEIKNLTLQSTPHNFPFRLYLINTIFPLQIIPIFLVITTLFSFNPSSRSSPFLGILLRCNVPPLSHTHTATFPRSIPFSTIVYPCCSLPPSQFSRRSSCHIMAALIYIPLIPLFLSKLFSILQFLLRSYILSIHQKVLFLLRLPVKS